MFKVYAWAQPAAHGGAVLLDLRVDRLRLNQGIFPGTIVLKVFQVVYFGRNYSLIFQVCSWKKAAGAGRPEIG